MACPDFEQKDDNSWEYVDQGLTFFIKKCREVYSIDVYSITGKKITDYIDFITENEAKTFCVAFVQGWTGKEYYDKK